MARKPFTLNTEPHVAEIGDLKLKFVAEVAAKPPNPSGHPTRGQRFVLALAARPLPDCGCTACATGTRRPCQAG